MAGALYIWIIGAMFVLVVGVMAVFIGLLYFGHWLERKQTGAKHGFLEVPEESKSRPARTPIQNENDAEHDQSNGTESSKT